jgi:hypothetical protein
VILVVELETKGRDKVLSSAHNAMIKVVRVAPILGAEQEQPLGKNRLLGPQDVKPTLSSYGVYEARIKGRIPTGTGIEAKSKPERPGVDAIEMDDRSIVDRETEIFFDLEVASPVEISKKGRVKVHIGKRVVIREYRCGG